MHRGKLAMVYFYTTEKAKDQDAARYSATNPDRIFAGGAVTVHHLKELINTHPHGYPILVIELKNINSQSAGKVVTFEQAKRELEVFDTEPDF